MRNPELTEELQQALDDGQGIVQGQSFVLMRPDVILGWFGYDSNEELRQELQPAFDQADRGELSEWNVNEFLDRMHQQHDAQTE